MTAGSRGAQWVRLADRTETADTPEAQPSGIRAASKLSVRGLHKRYGDFVALHPLDLEMREGEFLTLLGPSGSGKTTLLMAIAGLIEPDGGEIWLEGRVATYAPANKRDIGMVFQNYALFPHLSIFDNVAFPLRMRRMARADIAREVARALELVHLSSLGERLPAELSGGQQQRVALARCLVYRPSLVLMDEPLGALDKKLRDEMQIEVRQLCTRLGISVLYVTHDQEEAMIMSDRICLMSQGRIEQIGTPDELYFHPVSLFAAGFLGESNFLEGRLVEDGPRRTVEGPLGVRFPAAAAAAAPPGPVRLLVRPESVRVLGEREPSEIAYAARVESSVIGGAMMKLSLRLADGTPLRAMALTGSMPRPADGACIRVGWRADQVAALSS